MEIIYPYVRLRKEIGKHAAFTSQPAQVLFDLRPNEDYANDHIVQNPIDSGTQAQRDVSGHEVNTTIIEHINRGMVHTEGGWPKEVDINEVESTIRYRKKIERDEGYIRTVVKLAGVIEDLVKSNNAINIYQTYFPPAPNEVESAGPPTSQQLCVLKHECVKGRGAQYIAWHPEGSRRLVVAHSILEFQQQPPDMLLSSVVWDLARPSEPETYLQPASQLTCVNYNLKDHNLLGGGMYNGQFGVFDLRKGSAAVDVTPLDHSHRDPIYDFAWQQSKTGTEALTVSTDGNAFWWDIRRLEEPLETLQLLERGTTIAAGAMCLDYSIGAGPTKFMVGTEAGVVLACNRKGKTPADRVGTSYPGHAGAVVALARHPIANKYFLSCGDWSTRVWSEELRSPLVVTPYQQSNVTSARWSPTRPGVFLTAKADGVLDVWDLFVKQHEPVLAIQTASSALTSLRLHSGGAEVAAGSADGAVTVMRLSASLSEAQPNEKATVTAMLEREANREKNLEKAAKDAKARARRAADVLSKTQRVRLNASADAAAENLAKAEAEFYASSGIDPPKADVTPGSEEVQDDL